MGLTQGTPVTPVGVGYVPVSNWFNHIWPNVPMCPNPKIREAIIDAARTFFIETELWTEELELLNINSDQAEYVLNSPLGEMVSLDHYSIKSDDETFYRKTVISEIAIDENPAERDDWRTQQHEDPDAGWVGQKLRLRLTYVPSLDITAGLKVWLNIMPFEWALTVPKILWTHYKDTITSGALTELLMIANKPWTNPDLGAAHAVGFAEAFLSARQKKFSGFVRHRTRDIITTKYTDF
jgi:hypothetical protein